MRLKVIAYRPMPHDFHDCIDEHGNKLRIDLLTSGDLQDTEPESLVGKEVEVEWLAPYVSFGFGVKVV